MYKKFNNKFGSEVVTIFPGEIYVSAEGEIISTVLGSCIAVCLYDKYNKIGGMNHFMLPVNRAAEVDVSQLMKQPGIFYSKELRYGTVSMEVLIGELQKIGADRKNLKAKIFGGGRVLKEQSGHLDIGAKNIKFAEAYLKLENIDIVKKSVGEDHGRKIFFMTDNFKVLLKKVSDAEPVNIPKEESLYNKKIEQKDAPGSVDLF